MIRSQKPIGNRDGFTLLEILLVVAAIAILASIVIIAINPTKQLGETRDAQRSADVNTVMNALYQYSLDNNGNFPAGVDATTGTSQVLGLDTTGCNTTCTNANGGSSEVSCVDLSTDLVADYLVDIPFDPSTGDADNTDYYINVDGNNRLVVGACDPDQATTIEVTR